MNRRLTKLKRGVPLDAEVQALTMGQFYQRSQFAGDLRA
jgi:hypothetical protein